MLGYPRRPVYHRIWSLIKNLPLEKYLLGKFTSPTPLLPQENTFSRGRYLSRDVETPVLYIPWVHNLHPSIHATTGVILLTILLDSTLHQQLHPRGTHPTLSCPVLNHLYRDADVNDDVIKHSSSANPEKSSYTEWMNVNKGASPEVVHKKV